MASHAKLPLPQLDALPLGAHRALRALTDEGLFAQVGLRIAFTGREGGVSSGPYASLNCATHVQDDPAAVARNRQIALEALGAPDAPLVALNQVHGTDIVCVGKALRLSGEAEAEAGASPLPEEEEGAFCENESGWNRLPGELSKAVSEAQRLADAGADGIVVPMAGVAALLTFADCLPVILAAPGGAFAIAHAGWRGALACVSSKAAFALADATGNDPSQFNAYIGPHIRRECFEVSEEIADAFSDRFGACVLADKRHVSLADAVEVDLASAGLLPERIADAGICTKCHPDEYYSYRASDGLCGRHAAVAVRL